MGFPKIRNQNLCNGVLLAVLIAAFLLFAVVVMILPLPLGLMCFMGGLTWLIGRLLLSPNHPVNEDLELIFQQIRNEQKVRPEYVTDQNGTDREAITATLLKRLNRFGFVEPIPPRDWNPICLRRRLESEDRKDRTDYEAVVAVYSLPYLSESSYEEILADARERFESLHLDRPYYDRISGKKIPEPRFRMVIVLADTVAESVRTLSAKRINEGSNCWLLPCVVEGCSGKYYVDLREDMIDLRIMERARTPVEPCWKLPEQIVFGGRIPTNPVEPDWIDLDESLWSLLRRISQEQKVEFANLLPRARQLLRQMWDQEVRLEKNAVLVRSGNRLAICPCTVEGEHLTVHPAHRWVNCELGLAYRELVLLTPEEAATLEQQATACLEKYGYTVEWKN